MPDNITPKPSIGTIKKIAEPSRAMLESRLLKGLKEGGVGAVAVAGAKPSMSTLAALANTKKVNLGRQVSDKTYLQQKEALKIEMEKRGEEVAKRDATAMDNTINLMAENDGVKGLVKGGTTYNDYKNKIEFAKGSGNLNIVKDDATGKDIYVNELPFLEGLKYNWNKYHEDLADGANLVGFAIKNDDKSAIKYLNSSLTPRAEYGIPRRTGAAAQLVGQMAEPIAGMAATGMAVAAAVETFGLSEVVAAAAHKLSSYGAVAKDAVNLKYGSALKDYYSRAISQGMDENQAYASAKQAAIVASEGEAVLQAAFVSGGPIEGAIGGITAKKSSEELIKWSAKETFGNSIAKYITTPLKLGTIGAAAQVGADIAAKTQGIEINDMGARAIQNGSDLAIMDFAIRGVMPGLGKGIKSASKALLSNVDNKFRKDFTSALEKQGIYPKGTSKNVENEVASFKNAEEKTPDFNGDETRKNIVVGLTEKLINLENKQKQLHPDHQDSMNPEIIDIKRRIEIAKTAKDPFEAEVKDDGTPLIKTEQNATPETQKPVEEGGATSGISEHQGTETVQAPEAVKTDNSNSPIGSEEEKVSIANKIRKFKIDESVLTGGEKGAMQSNIAGLPIGIYNASVEAIALGVEAGESLVSAIDKQIEQLKKGGHKFNEEKFKKTVSLIDKANNNKAKLMAEAEMQGIKSSDYTELQRFALEKYNQNDIYKNPQEMAKSLRAELSKKMDTSGISDDVFEMIGYDALLNEKESPFVPGVAKKIVMPFEQETDPMRVSARDAFKGMYTAASTVGKSIKERASMAGKAVKEALKGQGLDLDERALTRSIGKFVTSKMDTDTAMQSFMDNLDDIVTDAKNYKINGENRQAIKRIKKTARGSSATAAIKDTTTSIDFISPSKVENPEEYKAHLENYHLSINGQVPEGKNPRQALIDYIDVEKEKYAARKRTSLETKYDKLKANGKIKEGVTKDDFVNAMMDPTKIGTSELVISEEAANNVIEILDEEAAEERSVSEIHKDNLREAINDGTIDESNAVFAKQLLGVDPEKVNPKNIKLFNNIMEDLINGEDASRVNDILTDVEVFDTNQTLKDNVRVRNMIGGRTAGFFRKAAKIIFGSKGSFKAYDEQSLPVALINATFNDIDTSVLYDALLHDFDKGQRLAHTESTDFVSELNHIVKSKSAIVNGVERVFKSPKLTEKNSYRIGVYGMLSQYADLYPNIQALVDHVIYLSNLSKKNDNIYREEVDAKVQALLDLGIVKEFVKEDKPVTVTSVDGMPIILDERAIIGANIQDGLTLADIELKLSDREMAWVEHARGKFAAGFDALNESVRNNYGESLDNNNPNYLPQSAKFYGEVPDVNFESEIEEGMPQHVQSMRASTTKARSENMPTVTRRGNLDVHVGYDWDYFKMIPEKYHETLITTHTAKATKYISKLINSSEFKKYMSGGEGKFTDNAIVIGNKIKSYVNMQRSPYVITKEIANQHSRVAKFLYGRVLNSVDQIIKQSGPSQAYLVMEGGVAPWAKANEIITKSITSENGNRILIDFLKQTAVTDRVTGGFETFHKNTVNIDDDGLIRNTKNVLDFGLDITGKPINVGDYYVSAASSIIGYMKALKETGKIKSYHEFDLESELKNGLNKEALAYSTLFLQRVNNVGNRAAKAKVFLENNAVITRLLQGFNHNQTMNFLADVGRWSDKESSDYDRNSARKRMIQYGLTAGVMYPLTGKLLNDAGYAVTKSIMKYSGVPIAKSDEQEEDINKLNWYKYAVSGSMDMMLGRLNVLWAQSAKGAASMMVTLIKKHYRDESEKMGVPTKDTWMSKQFTPIYTNDYFGISGTLLQKAEQLMNNEISDYNFEDELIKRQKSMVKRSDIIRGIGLAFPIKDIERAGSYMEKVIQEHPKRQVEYDAYHLIMSRDTTASAMERQESLDYIDNMMKKDKDFKSYLNTTVQKYIDSEYIPAEAEAIFGKETGKIIANISTKKGKDAIKVINNRYAGKEFADNQEFTFLIAFGGISAVDYAMAASCDKNGNIIIPSSKEQDEQMRKKFMDRYNKAYMIRKLEAAKSGTSLPSLNEEDLNKVYDNMASAMMQAKMAKE